MHEFEVEAEDSSYPAVDGSIRLDVRVAQHAFDVLGINFDYKVGHSD